MGLESRINAKWLKENKKVKRRRPCLSNYRALYLVMLRVLHPFRVNGRYTLTTSCSNKSQRHVTAINRFVCSGEFVWKCLSLQHNFAAAICYKNSNQTEFMRLVEATKFCCRDKDFQKISPLHLKRLVTAMYRCNMCLQLVAGPVHKEWSVAATCCCNWSPDLLTRSGLSSRLVAATFCLVCTDLNL